MKQCLLKLSVTGVAIYAMCCPIHLDAATVTWTNISGGNWNVPANWNPNQVPGAADTAFITPPGTYTVTLSDNESVNTLTVGSATGTQTLNISSGTFTLNGSGTGNAEALVSITGGTFAGSGALVLTGPLNWTGGTISGVVEFNGGSFSAATLYLNGGQLINSGTLAWSAPVFDGNGSIISNLAGATINVAANNGAGTQNWQAPPYTLYNAGQVTVAGTGTASFGDAFNNSGTATVSSGTLVLSGGGSDSGAFSVAAGATLNLGGGAHTLNSGSTISGAGNFTVSGGTANLGGSLSAGGTYTFSGGTANLTGNVSVSGNTLVVSGGTANFKNSGTLAPAVITVSSGGLGGTTLVADTGPLNWTGGTISGVVEFNGGSFSAATLYLNGGQLINSGTLAWSAPVFDGNGSIISNLAGATINVAANNGAGTQNWQAPPYTLYNAGQVTVAGTGTASFGDAFNNSGTATVSSGTLVLSGGGSDSGAFSVAAGATLNLGGGAHTLNSGSTISGAGNFTVSGGTANLGGSLSAGGTYTFSGGTANLTGNVSVSGNTLVVSGGTANFKNSGTLAPAVITVSSGGLGGTTLVADTGPLNWTGGTISGVVEFNGGSFSAATLYLNGGQLINSGTLAWSAPVFDGNGSIISNLAGATINVAANNGAGTQNWQAPPYTLYNAGQVTVAGTGTASFGDAFNNSGTATVSSGTLVLSGGGSDSGAFSVAAGATLNLGGGAHTLNSGSTISGAGNFTVSGGTANLGGSLSAGGTYTFSGGTANLTGNVSVSGNTLVVSGGTANFKNSGTLAPAVITVSSGGLGGTTLVADTGPLNWTGGTISGVVEFNGGSFSAATLYLNGGQLINSGTLAWSAPVFDGNGSIISNLAGATINVAANNGAGTQNWQAPPYTLYNAGQVTVAGTGTASFGDAFNNSGTATVSSGTLVLSGGGSDSGAFSVAAGATLNLGGGAHTLNSGSTISGAGNFTVSGGTANLGGSLSAGGTYTFSGGTANLTGNVSVSGNTLVVSGGTANFKNSGTLAPAVITVSSGGLGGTTLVADTGPLNWTGGTISGVVEFNGGSFSAATLYLNGGQLINSGTLAWSAPVFDGNGSIISNLAGATINVAANNGAGTQNWQAPPYTLYNAGQVTVAGTGTASFGDAFNNSGTVDVESGTLSLTGKYALTDGTLNLGISGVGNFGHVSFGGSPSLTGALVAHLNNGFFPSPGNSFAVLTYTSESGLFSSTNLPTAGLAWQINYGTTALTLAVTNFAPVVVITSPLNNTSFVAPTNITIDVTATDSNAAVTKVDFFQGANQLGEVSNSPYSLTWSNVPPGDYSLTATATGASGTVGVSSPVNIAIFPTVPGTNFVWVGGLSSDWFTAENWNPTGVPGPLDAANVANGGTVFLSRAASVACLDLASGNINGIGALTVTNTFYWTGGTLACPLMLTSKAVLTLNSSAPLYLENVLTNAGTVYWTGTGGLQLYNNGSNFFGGIVNLAGATFQAQNNQTISNYYGQEFFDNAGLFEQWPGTNTTTLDINFNNSGTVGVGGFGGTMLFNGEFNNTGVLDVDDGILSLEGTWFDNGLINGLNATVNFGGSFSLGSGAVFNLNETTVYVTGILSNSNSTLVLTPGSGLWKMQGGVILGGTVVTTNSTLGVSGSGTLDGVVLNGAAEVGEMVTGSILTVTNGLVLNGSIQVGNPANGAFGALAFGGSQSLIGNGTVVFGNASGYDNVLFITNGGDTLTIGPSITIEGQNGTMGSGANTYWGGPANVSIINQGTMAPNVDGGTIAVTAQPFNSQGTLEAFNGATLDLPQEAESSGNITAANGSVIDMAGSITLDGLNLLNIQPTGTLEIGGNLVGNTENAGQYSALGTVILGGSGTVSSPQLFEVMGEDYGVSQIGFIHNFSYGTITIANSTYVQLINQYQNSGSAGPEALYVNSLNVPAGTTLDLNGLHVYTRASVIAGTVARGRVTLVPNSGSIALGSPALGNLAIAGGQDQWTFFARAGQSYTILVDPGNDIGASPYLSLVELQLANTNGTVLAATTNAANGASVLLSSVSIPVDGTYSILVQAPPGFPSSTGHYMVTVWQTTPNIMTLPMNQIVSGSIPTPYSIDQWTFAATAGQQIRFHLVNTSGPGAGFDLIGPAGPLGFTNLTSDSSFINLPLSGNYSIDAHSLNGQYGFAYAFEVLQTAQTSVTLGAPVQGQWAASGQAALLQFTLSTGSPLQVILNNLASNNNAVIYAQLGQPPTLSTYAYAATASGPNQQLLIPLATAGTWYILVYANNIQTPGGAYTVTASAAVVLLSSVTPNVTGSTVPSTFTLTGAGFDGTSSVQFIDPSSNIYPATSISVDSFTQITATEAAGTLLPNTYAVRVSLGSGAAAILSNAFQVLSNGAPNFVSSLTLPSAMGYHIPSTVYANYGNAGDAAMPAPLMVVTPQQITVKLVYAGGGGTTTGGGVGVSTPIFETLTNEGALLTLNGSLVAEGLWTSATLPAGFANSVQFLASGQTPGVLQPGDSNTIPIYYCGWEQPWNFSYPSFTWNTTIIQPNDTNSIGWASLEASMQPSSIPADAWNAIFESFTNEVGITWGDYVTAIDNNASYLGQLGLNVVDVGKLMTFQLMQASGLCPLRTLASSVDASTPAPGLPLIFSRSFVEPISQRYSMGALGRGWSHSWQYSLQQGPNGTITITGPGGSQRVFQPDTRGGYFNQPGDYGTLASAGSGAFTITEKTGLLYYYSANGSLGYIQDLNNNRITLGYTGDLLTSLTHSAGPIIQISYNSAGLIETITDDLGRQTSLTYDSANQHLIAAKYSDGRTATYGYNTNGNPAELHELTAVASSTLNWRYFTYDNLGRLTGTYLTGKAESLSFAYVSPGQVTMIDALGSPTQFFYDNNGLLLKTVDANGNAVHMAFDQNYNLTTITDPAGRSYNCMYDSQGNIAQSTDPNGNSSHFTFTNVYDRLSSVTDANGNTSAYGYDPYGNLNSITYPDSSVETWSRDSEGNPQTWTNRRRHKTFYTFNNLSEITGKYFADGSATEYSYDSMGNVTNTTTYDTNLNPLESVTMTYNGSNNLTQVDYPGSKFLYFTYDVAGRRLSSVDQLGHTLLYYYDVAGRLQSLTNELNALVVSYQYDPAGHIATKTLGSGLYAKYQYDPTGQLLTLTNFLGNGSVLSYFNYAYDNRGRRTTMITLDGMWTYVYDDVGQLTSALYNAVTTNIPNQRLVYVYDAVGNRTLTIANGITNSYAANNLNEYITIGETNCTFDADGNLIAEVYPGGKTVYSYNDENRLISMTSAEGNWSNIYDGFSDRLISAEDGTNSQYVIDPTGFGNIVGAYDSSGNLIAHYDYAFGTLARIDASGNSLGYTFDGIGNAEELVSSSGLILNKYAYSPFGNLLLRAETISNPFQHVGQAGVFRDGNNLENMRCRFMSPAVGRFLSHDSLQIGGGDLNLYAYCGNNPVTYMDPMGLFQSTPFWTGIVQGGTVLASGAVFILGAPAEVTAGTVVAGTYLAVYGSWKLAQGAVNVLNGAFDMNLVIPTGPIAAANPQFAWIDSVVGLASISTSVGFLDGDAYMEVAGIALDLTDWSLETLNLIQELPNPGPSSSPSGSTQVTPSQDPNGLLGPSGYGVAGYIPAATLLSYRINFENATNAAAPAQAVKIVDQLSSSYSWTSFNVSEFGFGDLIVSLPAGTSSVQTNVPYEYLGTKFQVQVEIGIQSTTGEVYANFQCIDPITSLPPLVNIGFLPPEDGTGRGQGHVAYTIYAQAGLANGTQLTNVALISFDGQPSIATDQISDTNAAAGIDSTKEALITIDSVYPTSYVLPLPAQSQLLQIPISWTGQDSGGPGIATYNIYVSDNGSAWSLWQSATTNTNAVFHGKPQHAYGFSSQAQDYAGVVEPQHATADTATTVVANPLLLLSVSPTTTNLLMGATFNYTIIVSNLGTLNLDGVTMSNAIPDGLDVDFGSIGHGSLDIEDTYIDWALGNLDTNKGSSMVITATIEASGTWTNLFTVADSQGAAFASASQVITVAGPPTLTIALTGKQVVLAWPTNGGAYFLQTTTNLVSQASWTSVTNTPAIIGTSDAVTVPITNTSQFFRLQSQ